MPTINDSALIGFWPFNEPSGAPKFHNNAPRFANGKVSGISFDFHPAISTSSFHSETWRTFHPGTQFLRTPSGKLEGYRVGGYFDTRGYTTDGNPDGQHLYLGQGMFPHRRTVACSPHASQSGFTVGLWILPVSDGDTVNTDESERSLAKTHALIAKTTEDHGWMMGVSGTIAAGAQHNTLGKFGPHQLRVFMHSINGDTNVAAVGDRTHLDIPVEAGRYSHITFTMRNGGESENPDIHEFVLYKDGILEASGERLLTTNTDTVTRQSTTYNNLAVAIGASVDETDPTDSYDFASGWGNMISGVYIFERPLNVDEVLDMHSRGGFQPNEGEVRLGGREVLLTDSKLIAYYPFESPGFPDAGPNHLPLLVDGDEGDYGSPTRPLPAMGPFGRGGCLHVGSSSRTARTAGSGVTNRLIDNRSFTIAGSFAPDGSALVEDNVCFSMGVVDTLEVQTPPTNSMGFFCSMRELGNAGRMRVRIFEHGRTEEETILDSDSGDVHKYIRSHYAFVYDDETFGVAFYIDGIQQSSGNLSASFIPHMEQLAASGFPLCFQGAIDGGVSPSNPNQFLSNGGRETVGSEFLVMGRPLLPDEVYAVASSGIDTSLLHYTVHDPRLRGYWKGTASNKHMIYDRARVWNELPGNMIRSHSAYNWEQVVLGSDDDGPFFKVDYFGQERTVPPELASEGDLGFTSGVWAVMGGSLGIQDQATTIKLNRSNSLGSIPLRYKQCVEERDLESPHPYSQHIIHFEVTPSGNITPNFLAYRPSFGGGTASQSFNNIVYMQGDFTERLFACLTTQNALNADPVGTDAGLGPSGVSIVFAGRDGSNANTTPLVSGNLSFGVPNRVLLHTYSQLANIRTGSDATRPMFIDLYIEGQRVQSRQVTPANARIWSNDNTVIHDNDAQIIQIGGLAVDNSRTTALSAEDVGLGDNYMRDVFIMLGAFTKNDVEHLATSGIIDAPSIAGFTNQQATTQVTTANSNLMGYWRFTGHSGIIDLSGKGNHMTNLAGDWEDAFGFPSNDNAAFNLRFVPAMHTNADIAIQASGLTYASNAPAFGSAGPGHAISGVAFNTPELGFSVGFWYCDREAVATDDGKIMLAFGNVPTSATQTTSADSCWIIYNDELENKVCLLSKDGRAYMDSSSNAARAGSIRAGVFHSKTLEIESNIREVTKRGAIAGPHIDAWSHYAWTYDPAGLGYLTAYFNGVLVDRVSMDGASLNTPSEPESQIINVMQHMTAPWVWSDTFINADGIITDICYFDDVLTAEEVKYIAANGIENAVGVVTSGTLGGFMQGLGTGSGQYGGYQQGLSTISGVVGGYFPASVSISGMIGGFVSGVVFGNGTIGGFVQGLDIVSGIIGGYVQGLDVGSGMIAGYLQGQEVGSGLFGGLLLAAGIASGVVGGHIFAADIGSGLIGGYIIGGLNGLIEFDSSFTVEFMTARNFDAQVELVKTGSADFDTKIVLFQDEAIPTVDIIIPNVTVSGQAPPFNQYFVAKASGTQGKTIASTSWKFGDFTPTVSVAESGAGCYPVLHRYAASGFYIAKFTAIDSNGLSASATRIINAASGIEPILASLSGVPRAGTAALTIDFTTVVESLPAGVSIATQLLDFDDGQTTIAFNPTHVYTEPGTYRPVWCVRDSRGVIWCDSLEAGNDYLLSGG